MVDNLRILEQEYCPPLDPALVHAIYSDYAETTDGTQLARDLLDGLKQSAAAEQLTDFDPSGSSGDAVRGSSSKGSEDAESNAETWASRTNVTETTNASNDLSTPSLDGRSSSGSEGSDGGYFKDTEQFDTSTKELLLAETFPTLRWELVAYTLKKCDNNFGKATDELLNHVYFEDSRLSSPEETVVAKGIDAFSEENHVPKRGNKSKAKKKQKQKGQPLYNSSPASASDAGLTPTSTTNKWLDGNKDVDFISSRTSLSSKAVASLYHENGASLSMTIGAIIKKEVAARKEEPDAASIQFALDVVEDFPSVDFEQAIALIHLTSPSIANAHELAKALTLQLGTTTPKNGIHIIPRYAPILLSGPTTEPSQLPDLPPSARPRDTASLLTARTDAFNQASAAFRKGRSTPLMKAAAGYYSQVGRDLNANLKAMNEVDADALVSSQSSSTVLDLHGVSVPSATRIAKERTQAWWDSLGEQRIPGGGRRGAGDGYRIITGLGRHSEGGRGKIGPAVVRTLVKEGWKIEVGTGELLVTGVVRRK